MAREPVPVLRSPDTEIVVSSETLARKILSYGKKILVKVPHNAQWKPSNGEVIKIRCADTDQTFDGVVVHCYETSTGTSVEVAIRARIQIVPE